VVTMPEGRIRGKLGVAAGQGVGTLFHIELDALCERQRA
jgi:hypothetical protein